MWLKLTNPGPNGVRLLWGNDNGPYFPYHIGEETLNKTCSRVRKAMADVVGVSASGEPRLRARALHRLAHAGAELHYVLFDALDPLEKQLAEDASAGVRELYEGGDSKLRITGDTQVHVPWALVYEGNPEDIADGTEQIDAYSGFWGLKYTLSSTLSGYIQPKAKLSRRLDRARLLSLINFDESSAAQEKLDEELRTAYQEFLKRPVGVAHDIDACRRLIVEAAQYDTIMHIFAHHSGGELDLGADERIGIVAFKKLLDGLARPGAATPTYGLVILNACDAATGDLDYSFVSATERATICGLIGTEAVVPRDFAAQFAIRLLTLMLGEHHSIGESMWRLRHEPKLWPLSLLYGCYAQPDYRFAN